MHKELLNLATLLLESFPGERPERVEDLLARLLEQIRRSA